MNFIQINDRGVLIGKKFMSYQRKVDVSICSQKLRWDRLWGESLGISRWSMLFRMRRLSTMTASLINRRPYRV